MDEGRPVQPVAEPSNSTVGTGRNGRELPLVTLHAPGRGPAARVRRRERLVQVEAAEIETRVPGPRDPE